MSHAVVLVVLSHEIPRDEIEEALAMQMGPYYEYRDVDDGYNTENAKWDWYVIGGRWSEALMNTTHKESHTDEHFGDYDTYHGGSNILRKSQLVSLSTPPLAFLDQNGEWHEKGELGWWGHVDSPKEPDTWEVELKALLEQVNGDDWLIAVDYHI